MPHNQPQHWLDLYANKEYYRWREIDHHGRKSFARPLGLVESCFDADGRYHGGVSDMNVELSVELKMRLDVEGLRKRILLSWACLRLQHLLLAATSTMLPNLVDGDERQLYFVVRLGSEDENVAAAAAHMVFLDEYYESVDKTDLWLHSQNVGRIIDPSKALAKLFVSPATSTRNGTSRMTFLFVNCHAVADGISMNIWQRDFVRLLNRSLTDLEALVATMSKPASMLSRLPLPQEALYPPIQGSPARRRWFWLLTRILRHVRKPLPAGFSNPLLRRSPPSVIALSPTYHHALDYTELPQQNSIMATVSIPPPATKHLHRLCREAGVSVGAGCFALAALTMMEMHELVEPHTPVEQRKPFISGFPLNPRAFFSHFDEPNSCMLAFSDGIALPFLPSSLPLDGRLRLLARQAHRQLAAYQKRRRPAQHEAELQYMGSRGAGRVLATQYLSSLERADALLPEPLRRGWNPQGAYPMRPNMTSQTCGVSSVGRRDAIVYNGMYDLHDETKDLAADFRSMTAGVRAREGEFLIGIGGNDVDLGVNVSVDASRMDLDLVSVWKEKIAHVLDEPGHSEAKAML